MIRLIQRPPACQPASRTAACMSLFTTSAIQRTALALLVLLHPLLPYCSFPLCPTWLCRDGGS